MFPPTHYSAQLYPLTLQIFAKGFRVFVAFSADKVLGDNGNPPTYHQVPPNKWSKTIGLSGDPSKALDATATEEAHLSVCT